MIVLDWPGLWTGRVGEGQPRDRLHIDVVALAYTQGMQPDWGDDMRFNRYTAYFNDHHPLAGTGRLPDRAWSGDLEAMARRAVDWLNENAPPRRRFILTDGLYCLDTTEHPPGSADPATAGGSAP
jgi:hypothetical protein